MAEIRVGIADLNVGKSGDTIVTHALGSCVGVCLYDSVRKVAGLSHVMLPFSSGFDVKTYKEAYKFADLAIPVLLKKMEAMGAKKICITAKIAGGAKMFATSSDSDFSRVGEKNIQAVKYTLQKLGIRIVAEDTGLNYGRTQYLDCATGKMTIKSAKVKEKVF